MSPLQQLVRTARTRIVDPVLEAFPPLSSDEEEEPLDPEELRRIREREKIRELKRRRIHGGTRFIGMSGLGLLKADADAVFIREDLADESAEVDIDMVDQEARTNATTPSSSREIKMDIDTPPTSVASPSIPQESLPQMPRQEKKSGRVRRLTQKAEARAQVAQMPPSVKNTEPAVEDDLPKVDKRGKLRSDTYKQAWSVSEQHLLERLLEEIPDGEKNRSVLRSAVHGITLMLGLCAVGPRYRRP